MLALGRLIWMHDAVVDWKLFDVVDGAFDPIVKWFELVGMLLAFDNEDSDDNDIVEFDVAPGADVCISSSAATSIFSSGLVAFNIVGWRVLPSSKRLCNPDMFLKMFVYLYVEISCQNEFR